MRKFLSGFILLGLIAITGCDLQPKIASIPDSIGDFISERYPTLLAEPDSEIYQTAVADYGVYASPTVYGDGNVTGEDYVLYSPVDDYMMPNQSSDVETADEEESQENVEEEVEEDAEESGYEPDTDVDDLIIPDYVNEKPVEEKKVEVKPEQKQEAKPEPEPKKEVKQKSDTDETELVRAPLREITIEKGDTLYSVSRKYSVPVNDLAVMNKIGAPFTLSVGQKLKVPDILSVPNYKTEPSIVRAADKKVEKTADAKIETKKVAEKTEQKKVEPTKKVEQPKKDTTTKPEPKTDVKKATTTPESVKAKAAKVPDAKNTAAKKSDAKPVKKAEDKKTDVKKDAKKPDVKKQDTKKSETKKTDTKKVDTKKSESKKTDVKKKSDTKKTETKKTEKTQPTKQRTAQKMVARSSSKFSWPVRGKILSGYGSKSNGLFNDGINIKSTRGTNVLAAENGFVAYAGNEVKGMGNLVIIQHSDGWMTVYAHMDSFVVRRGHGVSVGQKIGTVGTSGKVDQPQLHFEIRKGTKAYNPINYLKK